MTTTLEPDRRQIETFTAALFCRAGQDGFVSVRAFYEDDSSKPFRITPTSMKGGLAFLNDAAEDDARRAAQDPKKVVFCPPLAVFSNSKRAREIDIAEGLALSVECDERPEEAHATLETILGPATVVVRSGGIWIDPQTGEMHDKLHLHWRLCIPARGKEALAKLKEARNIAARIVGGDPSNKPVCHPIRWPGSWHRKATPILCSIAVADHRQEIDLDAALAALVAATPKADSTATGNGQDQAAPSEWAELLAGIVSAKSYHDTTVRLAAKLLRSGMKDGAAVNTLRAWMELSAGPHDERWQSRYEDIPRSVSTAREKIGQSPAGPRQEQWSDDSDNITINTGIVRILSSAEFIAEFVPPDYIVDGLLQQGFLYSLTGQTGAGKTAITLRLAASTALGIPFAGRNTKKLRVLYLAAENPDDVRMRWIALAQQMDFNPQSIEVYFIEGVFKISEAIREFKAEAASRGGEFGLVVIDTSPAFYEGDDENSRAQMGTHARMLRSLIGSIPGRPCVIANCHPTKHATAENLLPAGGGSFLNEVDGNLTAAKNDSTVELHWLGKFRGVEFAAMHFLIRTVTHQDLKDTLGKLVPTVICEHISDRSAEEISEQKIKDEEQVLKLIAADPTISVAGVAIAMKWTLYNGDPHKTKATRFLAALEKAKLIKKTRAGKYRLTPEGKEALAGETEDQL